MILWCLNSVYDVVVLGWFIVLTSKSSSFFCFFVNAYRGWTLIFFFFKYFKIIFVRVLLLRGECMMDFWSVKLLWMVEIVVCLSFMSIIKFDVFSTANEFNIGFFVKNSVGGVCFLNISFIIFVCIVFELCMGLLSSIGCLFVCNVNRFFNACF